MSCEENQGVWEADNQENGYIWPALIQFRTSLPRRNPIKRRRGAPGTSVWNSSKETGPEKNTPVSP